MDIPVDVMKSVEKQEKDKRKKVLILSLGTGGSTYNKMEGDIPKQMYNNKLYFSSYQNAAYSFDGGETKEHAEFVAYPLINYLNPDYVFLVGTVKSVWTAFYSRFVSDDNRSEESIKKLYQIEMEGGRELEDNRIIEFQKQIQEVFDNDIYNSNGSYIRIILTKYGLNEDEVQFNYTQIRTIETSLDKENEYDVSFDITHSFRSLPLYNLIILNYIRQLSSIDIEIEHIFYGNLDVSREIGYAPIVDLKGIDKTLKITNAVSSFKYSGDASLLVREIPNEDLKKKLQRFDWATQINDIGSMEDSLGDLIEVLNDAFNNANEREKDLYRLVKEVCDSCFPSTKEFKKLHSIWETPYMHGYIQYRIGRWLLSVNRSGQATLMAHEAWRSLCMPIVVISSGERISLAKLQNFERRKTADVQAISKLKKKHVNESIMNTFKKAQKSDEKIKSIRDGFAHGRAVLEPSALESKNEIKVRKNIEDMYDCLEKIIRIEKEEWDNISNLFK